MPERLNNESPFDVLGDILETLSFRGSIFFQSDLAAPWGISLSKTEIPRFHIVLSGECFIGTEGHEAVRARETDVIVLPSGSSHWIADQPGRKLISSERAGRACELGNPLFQNGEITSRLMCGLVRFDQGASHPILDALPDVMHFPMLNRDGPIWSVIELIETEMSGRLGHGSSIADRLSEVLFLQLLNQFISESEEATGFLAALHDRRVYRALALIHREPGFDWSLTSLGEKVGMSRATLVRRFQEIVGAAPMAYINDWRIMKAHNLVKNSATPLEHIAEVTGFASARTLSRTFKRHYGCTPSELRRARNER